MVQGPETASNAMQSGFALVLSIRLCTDKQLTHNCTARVQAASMHTRRSAYLELLLG